MSKKQTVDGADNLFKTQLKPVWEKNRQALSKAVEGEGRLSQIGRWDMKTGGAKAER